MSEHPSHVSLTPDLPADTRHRAEQMVLRRAQDEAWPRQDVIDVMEALGLLAYRPGGRVGALGQRESLSVGEKRRRAETGESA